jgi:hypothetical protein
VLQPRSALYQPLRAYRLVVLPLPEIALKVQAALATSTETTHKRTVAEPEKEFTFAIIKPDAIAGGHADAIFAKVGSDNFSAAQYVFSHGKVSV